MTSVESVHSTKDTAPTDIDLATEDVAQAPAPELLADASAFIAQLDEPHRRAGLADFDVVDMYRTMLLGRRLDERIWALNRQGKAPFAVSSQGHEGAQVGFAWAMSDDDVLCPYYRDMAAVMVRGLSAEDILLGVLGRAADPCSGARQMPNHWGSKAAQIITGSSPIATHIPHAVGIAYARQIEGRDGVVFCSFGDGATSEGDFHEALNFAGIHRLPVVFVCENNGYAISVPLDKQCAVENIHVRAGSYDFPGLRVDGQSALDVYAAARDARERAARGAGPTLIEAKTYRYKPHTSDDNDKLYRSEEEVGRWQRKDPIRRLHDDLITSGLLSVETEDDISESVDAEIAAALEAAEASAEPEPADAYRRVYAAPLRSEAPSDPEIEIPRRKPPAYDSSGSEMNLIEAISATLGEIMDSDPNAVILGEDVGVRGGVFGATAGLAERHGADRVFDTPLAESLIAGLGIGMALDGMRPIIEIQFFDFIHPAIDQILNEAAKIHYRSNGDFSCPLVMRAPYGGGVHGALYHSQSIEALFCHVPGLKVVAPATPVDAAGLLRAAHRDPDPVLFLEHKKVYRAVSGHVPAGDWTIPIGAGDITREGSDLTIATYGMMRHHALEAADQLGAEGTECEVIDLRTLYPLDHELVEASVAKTGRLLVVHEANRTGGVGAELAAEITERAFFSLDAPVRRLAVADVPALAYAAPLEAEILFGATEIAQAARSLRDV